MQNYGHYAITLICSVSTITDEVIDAILANVLSYIVISIIKRLLQPCTDIPLGVIFGKAPVTPGWRPHGDCTECKKN